MKVFWADREGNPPPEGCRFHWSPSLFDASPTELVQKLPLPASYKPLRKTFSPDRKSWIRGIEKVLEAIQKKELEKAVLARCLTIELDQEPDPFAIAAALQKKALGAFLFCFQDSRRSFLGASPERLFVRKGDEILSEAVAGTRRRGKDPCEDEWLKLQLLSSLKELREFKFVQTYLKEILDPLSTTPLQFTPISVHATQNVQHLYSRCSATLKPGITDLQMLTHLHPTPALCGTPKQKALPLIQEIEPFERGLYGGVVGWHTPEASEWVVAIRSCLIEGKTVKLYSGTGIVEGSDPEEEWEELDQKLKLYEGIFL